MLASFRGYVFASLLLTTAVVSHAVYMKRFFYRSVIFLVKSKFAILAVGNMALVSVLLLWRLIQAIFLGPLRFREVERLHIRARDAVIECCFAISVFREEFDVRFVALVLSLLLLKSLHWLTKDRIEFLEEQPLSPARTHIRLVALMTLLLALDLVLVRRFATFTYKAKGPTMYVLFAFECTVLVIELFSDIVRYVFLVIDTSMEGHWEGKGMYSFYIELLSDLCQLTVYVLFFIYVQVFYSFPYHIIRELYMTFHKFQRRCTDFLRYRRVVATMNDLFADATEEELAEGDRTCIICREEMQTAKKLACGHLFHPRCLQSWLKRQLTCPTCRATIDVNGTSSQRDNHRNPNPNNGQQAVPANNNNNANFNIQVNNNNLNGNNQPAPQNNQGQVNLGDAGVRLINFANQWWNQVMIEAGAGGNPGAARGVGGGVGAARGNGAAEQNRAAGQGGNARANAGAGTGANGNNNSNGGAVGGAGAPGAPGSASGGAMRTGNNAAPNGNEQDAHRVYRPVQMAARQNVNYGIGVGGNLAFPRGPDPNAMAHIELRARRRGAWPQPFQPYHGQHNAGNQGLPNQQIPQNPGYPFNTFPAQQLMDQQYAAAQAAAGAGDSHSANPQSRSAPSGETTVSSASGSNSQGGPSGQTSNNNSTGASGAGESSANPSGDAAQEVPQSGGAQALGSSAQTVSASAMSSQDAPGVRAESRSTRVVQASPEPASSSPGETRVDSISLERLLAIQEQIEVLRSEVMELVLLATSSPPGPDTTADVGRELAPDQATAEASESGTGGDQQPQAEGGAAAPNARGNRDADNDSEAAVLRRRRTEFFSRATRR